MDTHVLGRLLSNPELHLEAQQAIDRLRAAPGLPDELREAIGYYRSAHVALDRAAAQLLDLVRVQASRGRVL